MKKLIGGITAALFAASLASAPAALAGPASDYDESVYILSLANNGYNGPHADELKLGYLLCALNQIGGQTPAGAEVYMNAAQATGLCDSVSTEGRPSKADLQTELKWALQQSWYR